MKIRMTMSGRKAAVPSAMRTATAKRRARATVKTDSEGTDAAGVPLMVIAAAVAPSRADRVMTITTDTAAITKVDLKESTRDVQVVNTRTDLTRKATKTDSTVTATKAGTAKMVTRIDEVTMGTMEMEMRPKVTNRTKMVLAIDTTTTRDITETSRAAAGATLAEVPVAPHEGLGPNTTIGNQKMWNNTSGA